VIKKGRSEEMVKEDKRLPKGVWRGLKSLDFTFWKGLASFLKLRRTTHIKIPHGERFILDISTDAKRGRFV
jgi:hypothetical protein